MLLIIWLSSFLYPRDIAILPTRARSPSYRPINIYQN